MIDVNKLATDAAEQAFTAEDSFEERCAYISGFKEGFWYARDMAKEDLIKIGNEPIEI